MTFCLPHHFLGNAGGQGSVLRIAEPEILSDFWGGAVAHPGGFHTVHWPPVSTDLFPGRRLCSCSSLTHLTPDCHEVIFQCQTTFHLPAFLLTTSFYFPQQGWKENRSSFSFQKKRVKFRSAPDIYVIQRSLFHPFIENPTDFPLYSSKSSFFLKYGIRAEHNHKYLADSGLQEG